MKKKVSLSRHHLAFAILLGIIACSKIEKDSPNANGGLPEFSEEDYFSQLGAAHNHMLDYVASDVDLLESTLEGRNSSANSYVDPTFGQGPSWSTGQIENGISLGDSIFEYSGGSGFALATLGFIDSSDAEYLNALQDYLLYCLDRANNELAVPTTQEFSDSLDHIVDNLITNSTITIDESTGLGNSGAVVLGTLEIARYSYSYWYNAAQDTTSEWGQYLLAQEVNKTNGFFASVWLGIRRAATDVWAFPSCGECGGFDPETGRSTGPYNLSLAWDYAGSESSAVN